MNQIPQNIKKIYLMAICGTGMGSLAGLLKARGFEVCGSDTGIYPPMSEELRRQDIPIKAPYHADNLRSFHPDLVIVGNAISKDNPEASALLHANIPYVSMPQALNHFFLSSKEVIVVAGTHGKTTTTSLMAYLLTELGKDPSFLIGGVSKNFSQNFRIGTGRYFVIEGDEYDTAFFDKGPKFLHYNPRHVILTSLEFDHADIYRDLSHITESFERLARIIPDNGSQHLCDAYPTLQTILCQEKKYPIRKYGKSSCGWQIRNFRPSPTGSHFEIHTQQRIISIDSPLSGFYNAENVAGVFSVLDHLKLDLKRATCALRSFQSVKRRQELLYEDHRSVVIDDFAHHPTAVAQTIMGIKQRYPTHHLIAVFEPRSNTSRRDIFQDEFALSFLHADEVIIAPVNHPEKVSGKILDVNKIVEALTQKGKPSHQPHTTEDIITTILQSPCTPRVILIMSNGDFDGLSQKLIKRLSFPAI